MRRERISQESGSSSGSARRDYKNGPAYYSRSSTYFRNKDVLICQDCYSDRRRKEFIKKCIKYLFWSSVVVCGLFFISKYKNSLPALISSSEDAKKTDNLTSKANDPPPTGLEVEQSQEEVSPQAAEQSFNVEKNQPDSTRKADDESAAKIVVLDKTNFDFSSNQIQQVAQKALNSGSSEMWEYAGAKGYAVVSTITQHDGQDCRSLFFTIIVDENQVQSDTSKMCKTESGKWEKE